MRDAFPVAAAWAALGERDSAFAWLERVRWQWPHRGTRADPMLDPVRDDPRFRALSARVDEEMGLH